MSNTKIEWADRVLNFIEADKNGKTCDLMSDGCENCFAQVYAVRLRGIEKSQGRKDLYNTDNETIRINFDVLKRKLNELPKKPQRIFLESMSDLFHKDIPKAEIIKVLDLIKEYEQHKFLILTKRFKRLGEFLWRTTTNQLQRLISDYELPGNVHFGISICNNEDIRRYSRHLRTTIAQINLKLFVSFEPLLESLDIGYFGHWVLNNHEANWYIVGAETGNRKRQFKEEWALELLELAKEKNIPFFFKKQYKNGKWTNKLDGKEYLEIPKEGNDVSENN